jgi:hypothetical protein
MKRRFEIEWDDKKLSSEDIMFAIQGVYDYLTVKVTELPEEINTGTPLNPTECCTTEGTSNYKEKTTALHTDREFCPRCGACVECCKEGLVCEHKPQPKKVEEIPEKALDWLDEELIGDKTIKDGLRKLNELIRVVNSL